MEARRKKGDRDKEGEKEEGKMNEKDSILKRWVESKNKFYLHSQQERGFAGRHPHLLI